MLLWKDMQPLINDRVNLGNDVLPGRLVSMKTVSRDTYQRAETDGPEVFVPHLQHALQCGHLTHSGQSAPRITTVQPITL